MLEAIVFDFDGLLVDTESLEFDSWSAQFEAHGVELDLSEWIKCVGAGPGVWSAIDHLESLVETPVDREKVVQARTLDLHQRLESLQPMPGADSLARLAKDSGVNIAIASSSTGDWVRQHLETTGLAEHFSTILTRDLVENPKPWPDLYLAACLAFGVDPAAAVAFEDSFNGVKAAKAAGMKAVAVPNSITRFSDFSHADRVVESLEQVDLELIDQLF